MMNHDEMLQTVSDMLDVAGLVAMCQTQYAHGTAEREAFGTASQELRRAGVLWANDIHRRLLNDQSAPRGKEKSALYDPVSKAVNDTLALCERDDTPAMLKMREDVLVEAKQALVTYLDANDEIISSLKASDKPLTHLMIAVGDVLQEAQPWQ